MDDVPASGLQRHFGLLQATALNVTMIVGAGVFITIPLMLQQLPGPYALLGWLVAGGIMLVDGLIWGELAATMPGSGGSYLYLLESYGRNRWGRLMAFLFIWQFLISGPLEIGSGLIAIAQFSTALSPQFQDFNEALTLKQTLWASEHLDVSVSPARLLALALGFLLILLLYRRIAILGKLTVTFWLGVLGVSVWILLAGFQHFDPTVAFSLGAHPASCASVIGLGASPSGTGPFSATAALVAGKASLEGAVLTGPEHFWDGLGGVMRLAMYSYLGYYSVCYIGDEVRKPGRTIPLSIFLSALLVCLMFAGLHLAMLGTVPWQLVPADADSYSLPAEFMRRIYGDGPAITLVTLLLIWSCLGSVFAGLLSYSRIPFGAARYGHFFRALGKVHPVHSIPHVSLLLVGGLSLFWSFFGLGTVIDALITTRIVEQFVGQIIGLMLLRQSQPERVRPFKLWLYPLPCGVALIGWLFMYVTARGLFIGLGLITLMAGAGVFLLWALRTRTWPFGEALLPNPPSS